LDESGSCYNFQRHFDNPNDTTQRCFDNDDLEIFSTETQTLLFHNSRAVRHGFIRRFRGHTSFHFLLVEWIRWIQKLLLSSIFCVSININTDWFVYIHLTRFDTGEIHFHCASLLVQHQGDEETIIDIHRFVRGFRIMRAASLSEDSLDSGGLWRDKTDEYFLIHCICLHEDIPRGQKAISFTTQTTRYIFRRKLDEDEVVSSRG
jgi:hypothetical protein